MKDELIDLLRDLIPNYGDVGSRDVDVAAKRRKIGRAIELLSAAPVHCQCAACKTGTIHASDCAVHNAPALPVGECDCGAAAPAQSAQPVPHDCDVRKILLRVVPGDGSGHEVYARNVADVEELLSEMGQRLEDFELAKVAPQPSPTAVVLDDMVALTKLPWLDQSTADPIEKARRVLDSLVDESPAYFFDDGFPRTVVREQVANVFAVLNTLARAASPQPVAQPVEQTRALTREQRDLIELAISGLEKDGCQDMADAIGALLAAARPASGETE